MQTRLQPALLATDAGREADSILRSCVHCGFCTATCPTFLLTGNELDSPRGRIYLLKEYLESGKATRITRTHLDRCLVCQSCETTCPSNVQYHRLLGIGQAMLAQDVALPLTTRIRRGLLLAILGSPALFAILARLGRLLAFLLPASLARQLPGKRRFDEIAAFSNEAKRKVVLLQGCVQSSLSPDTVNAAEVVLRELDIRCVRIRHESCCGAMHYHSGSQDIGLARARQLVDQLLAELDAGAEAIISTASGCGNFIKDYGSLFAQDDPYRIKAERVVHAIKDAGEFLAAQELSALNAAGSQTLAFHSPCTLQHGQQLGGVTEKLLQQLGFTLAPVRDSHLCCGSAGTYSLFQPELASALRMQKLQALEAGEADSIATANIGCQCHLAGGTSKQVRHWIEYVAEGLRVKKGS
jgi:glycolate oxidase iron-sulfur subunit